MFSLIQFSFIHPLLSMSCLLHLSTISEAIYRLPKGFHSVIYLVKVCWFPFVTYTYISLLPRRFLLYFAKIKCKFHFHTFRMQGTPNECFSKALLISKSIDYLSANSSYIGKVRPTDIPFSHFRHASFALHKCIFHVLELFRLYNCSIYNKHVYTWTIVIRGFCSLNESIVIVLWMYSEHV